MTCNLYRCAVAVLSGAFLTSAIPAHASSGLLKEQAPPIQITLPAAASGKAAIEALSQHLPAVAAAHGMSAEELTELLARERYLKVDRTGRLFYEDPDFTALGQPAPSESAAIEAVITPDQAFLLHSRPGAKRTIYLDFDGHVLSGTAWNANYNNGNDIICPPWDIDGFSASFNDTERNTVIQVWQRVAEDYAPFDVDVTTEYPGEAALTRSTSTDDTYGIRVLISPISSYVGAYGGVAYVGAFNDTGDYYKPALVFPERLANSEKYIAEAAAHEAGHTLGLSHDGKTDGTGYYSGQGSGETGWAPIMGVGYYQNLSQWSKGEYALANNKEDDLAIINTYVLYRTDDHGNDNSSATLLPAGSTISGSGVIERNTDRDVFRFSTGAGAVTINVLPYGRGPNLDALAELYDSGGNLVATGNPLDSLAATFNLNLSPGTYFLHVRGTGKGDPLTTGYTSYASLGGYTFSGAVVNPTGALPPIANANATPTSGNAPLTVQFDSTQSVDSDGSIVAYFWDFGDGTISQEANPTHAYTTPGTFTAQLTVTDNSSLIGTDSVAISVVQPNVLPTALASATPSSGYAPLVVFFDGSASYDADGSIVSYQWNFGDGSTSSGASVQHTYQSAGTYTATLTVTDNFGGTTSTTVTVQVAANPANVVRVAAIALNLTSVPGGKQVNAVTRITNLAGSPIAGAVVMGSFSGAVSGPGTATTDANGEAVIVSKKFKRGTVTFTVTGVSKTSYAYNSAQNVVTSASIAAAALP